MSKNTTNNNGIGFIGLLTILFIGLKLTGYINWSWWFVLSPLILYSIIWIILFIVYILILLKK